MSEATVKKARFSMVGINGNAYAILGGWSRAARRDGWKDGEIQAVLDEAKSDDYNHLLRTIIKHSEGAMDERDDGDDEGFE